MSNESLSKEIHTPLHDALQQAKRQEQKSTPPRHFWLEYNQSKLPTKNTWTEAHKRDMQSCWGTLYPDGGVSLSIGSYFGSLKELCTYLEAVGEYSITGLEEVEKEKHSFKVGDQVQYVVDAVISDIDADIPSKAALSELTVSGEAQSYIDFSVGDYIPVRHLRKRVKI